MTSGFSGDNSIDSGDEIVEFGGKFPFGEVPATLDILPESGQEILQIGDVRACGEFNHRQGDNPYGFQGTCGLVSCEDVLRQFGVDVTEGDVVRHAIHDGLCNIADRPDQCGGTTTSDQAAILSDAGVPAHAQRHASLADLDGWVETGRGVIIEVNAGELWNDPRAFEAGQANHAIVVTGVALDPNSGQTLGYYINDSGRGYHSDSGRFISADLMQHAWIDAGGTAVITDTMRADAN